MEQQLADSKALCQIKQRELEGKLELIVLAEQQLLHKDDAIRQENQRLQEAKLRRVKYSTPPTPPPPLPSDLWTGCKTSLWRSA